MSTAVSSRTVPQISRPPIVGVPVFSMWLLGPSTRTFLPSPRRFKKLTNG